MSDGELLCNFKKCRKILTGIAYITRCSHAFCEEDGINQIENQNSEKKCPACQSPLVKNYDLVKVTLNPSEQFKSRLLQHSDKMVLAGLRPEVVMDVATRAITFWSYQQHQEQLHQTIISKSLKDFLAQVKSEAEVEAGFLKAEIQTLKRKQEDLEKELEKQTLKCNEFSEKITQKTREIQKWQMLYESLKRKQLSALVMQREHNQQPGHPMAINVGPQTMDELLLHQAKAPEKEYMRPSNVPIPRTTIKSPIRRPDFFPIDDFVFQPRTTNPSASPKAFFENAGNFKPQGQRKYPQ